MGTRRFIRRAAVEFSSPREHLQRSGNLFRDVGQTFNGRQRPLPRKRAGLIAQNLAKGAACCALVHRKERQCSASIASSRPTNSSRPFLQSISRITSGRRIHGKRFFAKANVLRSNFRAGPKNVIISPSRCRSRNIPFSTTVRTSRSDGCGAPKRLKRKAKI